MLRLDIAPRARWIDLGHGVRLHVEPLTTAIMSAARRDPAVIAVVKELRGAEAGAGGHDLPDVLPNVDEAAIVMAKAVARRVVTAWEGVGDAAGKPVKVTPEGLDALMDIWVIFDAFQHRYLAGGFLLESEKNGSAPSPSGTSAGAIGTAKPAKGRARTARKR